MIKKTKFKDLILVNNKSFKDNRGYFKELLLEKNINKKFPFLVMSYSKKNVIRGLHLQLKNPQTKIISVRTLAFGNKRKYALRTPETAPEAPIIGILDSGDTTACKEAAAKPQII